LERENENLDKKQKAEWGTKSIEGGKKPKRAPTRSSGKKRDDKALSPDGPTERKETNVKAALLRARQKEPFG